MYICLKYTQSLKINAGNSLSANMFAINNNVCSLYKQCLILRNSTKHFNNTTPILMVEPLIESIYLEIYIGLLIEVYLWNKFLGNSMYRACHIYINSQFYSSMYL